VDQLADPEFRAKAEPRCSVKKVPVAERAGRGLRKQVEKAQEYRDRSDQVINKGREGAARSLAGCEPGSTLGVRAYSGWPPAWTLTMLIG